MTAGPGTKFGGVGVVTPDDPGLEKLAAPPQPMSARVPSKRASADELEWNEGFIGSPIVRDAGLSTIGGRYAISERRLPDADVD